MTAVFQRDSASTTNDAEDEESGSRLPFKPVGGNSFNYLK